MLLECGMHKEYSGIADIETFSTVSGVSIGS